MTNRDVNDSTDPRVAFALGWLGARPVSDQTECMATMKTLCSLGGDGGPAICLHFPDGGTVSSSVLALRPSLAVSSYWHAQGPPDQTPYADFSYLLAELAR